MTLKMLQEGKGHLLFQTISVGDRQEDSKRVYEDENHKP